MTREEFIRKLGHEGYTHKIEGDKIIVTYYTNVYLNKLESIPENVIFDNGGSVYLDGITELPEGIQFTNKGSANMKRLTLDKLRPGVFKNRDSFWCDEFNNINWKCNIPGVSKGRVFDLTIKRVLV